MAQSPVVRTNPSGKSAMKGGVQLPVVSEEKKVSFLDSLLWRTRCSLGSIPYQLCAQISQTGASQPCSLVIREKYSFLRATQMRVGQSYQAWLRAKVVTLGKAAFYEIETKDRSPGSTEKRR